jgi:hypothetical protein
MKRTQYDKKESQAANIGLAKVWRKYKLLQRLSLRERHLFFFAKVH